jgi:hypothetical protein
VTLTKWTTGRFLQIKPLRAQIKKRPVITLEQKFDMIERHERGHSNSEIGQDVGMPDCDTEYYETRKENKVRLRMLKIIGKSARANCDAASKSPVVKKYNRR